jgi:UDP-2,4-diacetamido-2,4,6-trideoxy-beta-L-altropyranose hydrolase
MKILVRVDAYPDIALGHLNRCVNLGISLRECGHSVTFLSYNDSATQEILSKTRFEYKLIPFKINDKQSKHKELSQLEALSDSIDLLLVDSYNVDKDYFDFLNKCFPVIVYLDDLGLDFDVDMVINPSCRVMESDYKAQKVLCGIQYVILGDGYVKYREEKYGNQCDSILVTMGGIDHYNISVQSISILEEIAPDIEINMVIGPYYDNVNLIESAAKNSKLKINLFKGVTNIIPIISKSDIALSAGGFTLYELASTSTPSIGISLWENQESNVRCLSNGGFLLPVYYSNNKFMSRLKESLSLIIDDKEVRVRMSQLGRKLVDGKGVERISKEITTNFG